MVAKIPDDALVDDFMVELMNNIYSVPNDLIVEEEN